MPTKYYQKNTETRERYQNLSEEVKNQKRKKARERYQNFPKKENEKKVSILS